MLKILFNNKKIFTFIIAAFVILCTAFLFTDEQTTSSQNTTDITPTLFIHGFKGGPGSFNTMLERIEHNGWGSRGKIFHINGDGEVEAEGQLTNDNNPLIQVLFEDNRASLANQTVWLQNIMMILHETYDIKQVNLVGHSMGGLAASNYLLHNKGERYPEVDRLVVMGSPFTGIHQKSYFNVNTGAATVDLQPRSEALENMAHNKENFDDKVSVLAIAGVINNDGEESDGLVSKASALGIKDIVPAHNYQEEIFYDSKATHSGLHEHTGVDKTVAEFLWNDSK
ncbi:alpha/beta fold hydrolase [Alteribacillus sp. JSM 102045]|uniref:alpha/beta fold hydrolase n=1 Tax=Alteribacillus sp. JSM 102045 TaxID=1562101 RepID=UPI0035C118B8